MGKKLGQYFLVKKAKIQEIIDALEVVASDSVIEIGPGHGELTNELIKRVTTAKIFAIERDEKLAGKLNALTRGNLKIIRGDALKILPDLISDSKLPNSNYKIVGNIPFYITGRLLRVLGELEKKPKIVVLTIQKEVAERVVAAPPKLNLLAASVQFWANPEIIDFINRKDFKPRPEVDSAIIRLRVKNYESKNMKNYYKLIKILFKQPRKTILNNLYNDLGPTKDELKKTLKELGINFENRPQNLNLEQIENLSVRLIQDKKFIKTFKIKATEK